MLLGMEVGLSPGDFVLDGDLCMEVGLGPGHIVLDGTQPPSPKGEVM